MTTLPDFQLASWEMSLLPEGEPLCAPATRRVEVRQGRLNSTYRVRDLSKPVQNFNKILVRRDVPGAATLALQFDISNPFAAASPVKSDAEVVSAIENKKWARMIYLNKDLKLVAKVGTTAHHFSVTGGGQTLLYGTWGIPVPFLLDGRPREEGWGETIPARLVELLLNKGWSKTTSDCHFAFRWAPLSFEERVRWLYECERGTVDECEKVLRWFLISGSWWDSAGDVSLALDMTEDVEERYKKKQPLSFTQSRLMVTPNNGSPRFEWISFSEEKSQLLSLFDRYFGLRYNKECWAHLRLKLHRAAPWSVQVLEVPTMHERMEARLQLRDWLKGKVAPDEIPFLLGEA